TEKSTKEKREFYIPKLNRERDLYGTDYEIRLRNQLSQKAIARECAEWIRAKVRFKTNITDGNMPSSMVVTNEEDSVAYTPFNQFSTTELGCEQGNNLCTQIMRFGLPNSKQFLSDFADLWSDRQKMEDVTEKVLDNIETVYRENGPEFIYFVTLYNIFHEFLEDISEDVLPNEATGFKSSCIWKTLYNFQKDAALAIINKLERYNGCILADSVGLGKTYTALAVIKYYENRNKSVLVLCPKKLNENWQTFNSNYLNNPLAKDRLRYDIFFHTDLSRERGLSNGKELGNINWGNYDLVVIDESHNFRNGGKITTDEDNNNPRENRYLRLMNKIIRAGVKTKVLMLSATPVNNRFNDLKNQLALAYEGKQENINPLLNTTRTVEDIFRQAQLAYNNWTKMPPEERTTQGLLDRLDFDFFEVLDAVTIARSRKHIEKYYDTTDIGQFPDRLKPISKRPPLTEINNHITFTEIAEQLDQLNLSVYAPSYYIQPSNRWKYGINEDGEKGLSMAGREKGIRRLMAINMLKRLESSVNSFELTLNRIKEIIDKTIDIINQYEEKKQATEVNLVDVTQIDWDFEDSEDDILVGGKKTNINLADMDWYSWRNDLKHDQEIFGLLLTMLAPITPEHDSKLQMLIDNLREKWANPINGGNKKVIIFTAFSDTAEYLYNCLSGAILKRTGMYTGMVTGDMVHTNLSKVSNDFNTILT
ncbi:MAG: DEAD/DEAH box helicase family protein, partial [Bacteroidales bacterium]|nr:DEAD/DEAH box helicase family protein [Bacteroidales bacterium]